LVDRVEPDLDESGRIAALRTADTCDAGSEISGRISGGFTIRTSLDIDDVIQEALAACATNCRTCVAFKADLTNGCPIEANRSAPAKCW